MSHIKSQIRRTTNTKICIRICPVIVNKTSYRMNKLNNLQNMFIKQAKRVWISKHKSRSIFPCYFFKASTSIFPWESDETTIVSNPTIDADAGLVPCEESGITILFLTESVSDGLLSIK